MGNVESENGDFEVWVQSTSGSGNEWRALATGLTGGKAAVPLTLLPPGESTLRLLAGDGFQTSASRRVRVTVPDRGPEVSILAPRDGETLVAGNAMRLYGATTGVGSPTEEQPTRWLIDGKEVAKGIDVYVAAPEAGRHTLELRVGSGRKGGAAEADFVTIDLEREARRSEHRPSWTHLCCSTGSTTRVRTRCRAEVLRLRHYRLKASAGAAPEPLTDRQEGCRLRLVQRPVGAHQKTGILAVG